MMGYNNNYNIKQTLLFENSVNLEYKSVYSQASVEYDIVFKNTVNLKYKSVYSLDSMEDVNHSVHTENV